MNEFVVRFEPDPNDEVGKLWFSVQTELFSATIFYWSNLTEVPDFVRRLDEYPLSTPAKCVWGYESLSGFHTVAAIEISQSNEVGLLEARVELADQDDTEQRLMVKLETEYALLDLFRAQLTAMVGIRSGEAVLRWL